MKIKLTQLDFAVTSTQNTFAELTKKKGILNNDRGRDLFNIETFKVQRKIPENLFFDNKGYADHFGRRFHYSSTPKLLTSCWSPSSQILVHFCLRTFYFSSRYIS